MARAFPGGLRGAAALCIALVPGCYHLVEPIRPDPLPRDESEAPLPRGVRIRVVNGFEEPFIRSLRTEGIHHLDVDLRAWTARLVAEVAAELRVRGVRADVPSRSLAGTSVADEEEARRSALWRLPTSRSPDDGEALPTLKAWVLHVRVPPRSDGGPSPLEASLESADGAFSEHYAAIPGSRGFRAAFLELKRRIVGDPRLRVWLEAQVGASEGGPSVPARAGSE